MTRPHPPRPLTDLMAATGLGRDAVKAAIRNGELPGQKIGDRYVIPDAWFRAWERREWIPTPKPEPSEPTPIRTMGRRVA